MKKSKKNEGPWWENDDIAEDTKCALCDSCRKLKTSQRCMFGGPFTHYLRVSDGKKLSREETKEKGAR